MTERFLMEVDGSEVKFRISKPGKSVASTNIGDFVVHESAELLKPNQSGSYTFGAVAASQNVTITPTAKFPFVVLKASDNSVPGPENFHCRINNTRTVLTLSNQAPVARTIFWFLLDIPGF